MIKDQAGYITELRTYEEGDMDTATANFSYEFNQDSSIVNSKAINKADSTINGFYEDKYNTENRLIQLATKIPSEKGIIL